MKKVKIFILLFVLAGSFAYSQDTTRVTAQSDSVAANLDLEAVASVFGEAKDLEDFEKKLNDPDAKINNLDLNGDGKVDYLRVLEKGDDNVHVVTIQAVLGKDLYQDVATIDVVKDEKGETQVQVVGDVDIYGSNYIVQPVYVQPPVIVHFFWSPMYHPWHSPYYWGRYPPYYRPWPPYPPYVYRRNVHVHVNNYNTYNRSNVRYSSRAAQIQSQNRRNDYGKTRPATNPAPKTRPTTTVPKTKPSATVPNTRPATTTPKPKPSVSVPKTQPTTTVPKTRPATTAPKTRPASPRPAGGGLRRRR